MSRIEILDCGIISAKSDAVVNAANEQLQKGDGVCGVIFSKAGARELQQACNNIGHCPTGSAVITPAFKLDAKFIIHAVGPRWQGGTHNELKYLYGAYYRSLELARDNGCASIAFPLLSAGIFNVPVEKSWRKGLQACADFFKKNPGYECTVRFTVPSAENRSIGFATADDLGITVSDPGQHTDPNKTPGFVFFWHEYEENGCFSQWYPADMIIEGIKYVNCEQYMMAKKALAMNDLSYYAIIMHETDPQKIKDYGGEVRNFVFEIWDACNEEILFNGNYAKFSQNPILKQKLLATGNSILVEASPYDPIYGIKMKASDPDATNPNKWKGKNLLGSVLMRVREALNK